MLVVYPSNTNEIYLAFKTLRNLNIDTMTTWEMKNLANELIRKIAEQQYKDGCVIGHMIMMDDLEEMAKEESESDMAAEQAYEDGKNK